MLKTQPKRGSFLMRFAKCAGKLITYTRSKNTIRLYNHEGALVDLLPSKFRAMLKDDQIQHLDLPHDLKEDAERLSDEIGDTYDPTEALDILQSMVQDHPTTLNSNAK